MMTIEEAQKNLAARFSYDDWKTLSADKKFRELFEAGEIKAAEARAWELLMANRL